MLAPEQRAIPLCPVVRGLRRWLQQQVRGSNEVAALTQWLDKRVLKPQNPSFAKAKLATGKYFFHRILTRTDTLMANLRQQDADDFWCLKAASF